MTHNILVFRRLGHRDYLSVWNEMKTFTEKRTKTSNDTLWSVEHDPVYTQGQGGKSEHILDAGNIPVVQTDRGGQVTYHGPGQLVIYALIDLLRKYIRVREFVSRLENAVIAMLSDYGIIANSHIEAPGVYVHDAKICSIGLKVKRGCTYHGIALNVDMDLEPFSRINPCGFRGLKMTQMKDLILRSVNFREVEDKIVSNFLELMQYDSLIEQ